MQHSSSDTKILAASIVFAAFLISASIIYTGIELNKTIKSSPAKPSSAISTQPQGTVSSTVQTSTPSSSAQTQQPSLPTFPDLLKNPAISLGPTTSKVTMIEFVDYQCPICKQFATATFPRLKQNYIDTGRIHFVFHDFPVLGHDQAPKAAEAARCAGEQGKYLEMHDKLFQNQTKLAIANLKNYAESIGLNRAKFDECLDTGKHAAAVKQDAALGKSYGIKGTPSFAINGQILVGALSYESFQSVIESAEKETS